MRCKQMLSLSVVTVLLAASLAGCGTSSTATAKAAESTENALENIAHVAKAAEITCSAASSGKVRVYTSMPKLVIPCPFVCI